MTTKELEPYVGRAVAVYTTASENAVTGLLARVEPHVDPPAYELISADGEVPPVLLEPAEIVRIEG